MVAKILKEFKVKGYKDLYKLYLEGELGSVEQRMPNNIEKEKANGRSEIDLMTELLNHDSDNLWNISLIDYGIKSYFVVTLLGFQIVKEFNEPVIEYVLTFGEDGIWQDAYQIDNPSLAKDGSVFGKLSVNGDI